MGNNTAYRQIGFDGFEEYDFDKCADDHFSFENSFIDANDDGIDDVSTFLTITNTNSHSGRKSIRIAPNSVLKMTKNWMIVLLLINNN